MFNPDIICIGESLIELSADTSLANAETLTKYYGGDCLTTAVSASRLGANVGLVTVIGNDYLKDFLFDACVCENLDTSQIRLSEGTNGLYFISRCKNGKKEFIYHRKKTAAASLCEANISSEYIKKSKILYSTGITQSLSINANEAVKTAFRIAKDNDVKIAYDLNYTEAIWTAEEAKEAFDDVIPYLDIVFASLEHDIKPVLGINSADLTIKHLWDNGISIAVIREENGNVSLGYNGEIQIKTQIPVESALDATGSGDAFNGGFLYGLIQGYSPYEALKLALIMSYFQVQGIGAIKSIPNKNQVLNYYSGNVE